MNLIKILFFSLAIFSIQLTMAQPKAVTIPNFTLNDVITSQPVSLTDFSSSKAIVVIFTSNTCPYSKLYEDRILELSNKYKSKGVEFLLINSNNSSLTDVDNVFRMRIKANSKKFTFPYLEDKQSLVKNIFKSEKTPESFVLANKNGAFILSYHGAIDDNPQSADLVKENYIELALNNIIKGKPSPVQYERPVGCRIKSE